MNVLRLLPVLLVLPLTMVAAERAMKIDRDRSFIDVDVDATKNFTAHLDAYDAHLSVDDTGRIKTAVFTFKFADLKTGNEKRDADMIKWLGGGAPEGKFELGNLALAPNGQGEASGRFTMHGITERIEFPVEVTHTEGSYTITGETTLDYRTWGLKVIRSFLLFTVDAEVRVRFKFTGTPAEAPAN